jgi:type II secretory pathway pseudopilin PulG
LIELLIVMAVFLIAGGITFMALLPAWQQARINSAYNTTLMMMRQARQYAVDDRKAYIVNFIAPGTIQIQRVDAGVPGPIITQVSLPSDIQFSAEPGIPNTSSTTPDNMGTGAQAIDFDLGVTGGIGSQVYFYPDGSARDINNNINNGIVYIARPGDLYSSRAITLYGGAGRTRGWRLYPPTGVGGGSWSAQ